MVDEKSAGKQKSICKIVLPDLVNKTPSDAVKWSVLPHKRNQEGAAASDCFVLLEEEVTFPSSAAFSISPNNMVYTLRGFAIISENFHVYSPRSFLEGRAPFCGFLQLGGSSSYYRVTVAFSLDPELQDLEIWGGETNYICQLEISTSCNF